MKARLYCILIGLILCASCKNVDGDITNPDASDLLLKGFKAKEVTEGAIVVYDRDAASQIIPGYANYRMTFSKSALGGNVVKLVEYSGETFEGTWLYDKAKANLTLTNLSPTPAAGDLVYEVVKLEANSLILRNTTPNPKTGETINQYSLIPE